MAICRSCNKEWGSGVNVCPEDGTPLDQAPTAPGHGNAALGAAATAAPTPRTDDPPPTQDLIPGTLVGEYRVDKKIGEGGMGAVYSATHPMIGKRAAIKVISAALGANAEAVGRFVQEAQSVNQIGHPNIVDVFAFGELPDGRNYFVMEYLQGQSLADKLHKGSMPLGEAIEILDQVADALEAAHEKSIVHRDLKPDNVYLAAVRGGRTMVKLLDFGIAKMSTPDSAGSGGGIAKTRTGMMMGTPGYLSPEQARGKNVDHRTDIYALGCMTFEIACGRLPFVADSAMDIVLMHMVEPPPRASTVWPEIPAQLDELINSMLAKEPAQRPTLQQVRTVFAELVSSGLVTLTTGRGLAFGSGISKYQTPQPMAKATGLATGTQPAQPRPPTGPGTMAPTVEATPPAAKSKTPLIAAVAGVLLLGGAGAFFALKGGDDAKPKAAEPPIVAAPTPTPEPPTPEPPRPVEPPKPVEPKVVPATIEIAINVEGAMVTVDDNPVQVVGKTARAKVDAEGEHKVIVTANGRNPFESTVTTKSGETQKLEAKLEKPKSGTKPATVATKPATTTTPQTKPATTTSTPQPGTGSAAKPGFVDKNAPIDPF